MTQGTGDFLLKLLAMFVCFACVSRVASCQEHRATQERIGYEARAKTVDGTRELQRIWERQRKAGAAHD